MIVLDSPHLLDQLVIFMLVSIRISAMLITAPMFSTSSVTVPIRVVIALSIAVLMLDSIDSPKIDILSPQGVMVIVNEAIIGTSIGLMFQLAFAAISLMGEQVSTASGLGFASMLDPYTGSSSPVITQFMTVMMLLTFMTLEGPHILLQQLAASFQPMPIGTGIFRPEALLNLIKSAGVIFSAALLISLPIILALFLLTLTIGMLTRVAPQLNLFSVGFPITLIGAILLILIAIPSLSNNMSSLLVEIAKQTRVVLLSGSGAR